MNGKEAPNTSSIRPKLVDTCLQGYSVPVHSLQDSLNRTFQKHRSSLLLIIAIEDNLLLGASTYAPSQQRVIKHSSLVTLTPWSKRGPHHRGRQKSSARTTKEAQRHLLLQKESPKAPKMPQVIEKEALVSQVPALAPFHDKVGANLFFECPDNRPFKRL